MLFLFQMHCTEKIHVHHVSLTAYFSCPRYKAAQLTITSPKLEPGVTLAVPLLHKTLLEMLEVLFLCTGILMQTKRLAHCAYRFRQLGGSQADASHLQALPVAAPGSHLAWTFPPCPGQLRSSQQSH